MANDIVPGRDPVVDAALTANHREFRHFLIRRLGNTDDAEDVLQQFYLRALSNAGSLRKGESVVAWLYRMCRVTRRSGPEWTLWSVSHGTHGRTGLAHILRGSVAEKVLRHAPCPVLVTRERT